MNLVPECLSDLWTSVLFVEVFASLPICHLYNSSTVSEFSPAINFYLVFVFFFFPSSDKSETD